MMSKVFSQEHYEQDDWAKYQIIEWLERKGYEAWVNPDKFGIDILATRWGRQFAFEVEVKHNWRGRYFPYEQIHFSARKRKFVALDVETWFVMLNHERTMALLVEGEHILSAPIVNKDTKYSLYEAFVEVDIQWAIFRDLKEETE
jgi:hypothetical protein